MLEDCTQTDHQSGGGRGRQMIIGCPVVLEALTPYLAADTETLALDAGLHVRPESLRQELQKAILAAPANLSHLILAYGLCSGAADGIKAGACTLVVPKVDDCIGLFLGSRQEYRRQVLSDPGTYYLTRGWIDAGITPFDEYQAMVTRWGEERAEKLMRVILKNYKRLVFIRSESGDELDFHEEFTRKTAQQFNLRAEFITGSADFMKKLVRGPWDHDFIVLSPGQTLSREDFK